MGSVVFLRRHRCLHRCGILRLLDWSTPTLVDTRRLDRPVDVFPLPNPT